MCQAKTDHIRIRSNGLRYTGAHRARLVPRTAPADVWTTFLFLTRTKTPDHPDGEPPDRLPVFYALIAAQSLSGSFKMMWLRIHFRWLLAGVLSACAVLPVRAQALQDVSMRSEEHTSELQSLA